MAQRGKRGRRPLPPGEGKRVPLNMRTTAQMREKMEDAARESGRSLAQEVEHRLDRSFLAEEAQYEGFGGKDTYDFCRYLAIMANLLTRGLDKSWKDDPTVFQFVVGAWTTLVRVQAELPVDLDRKGGKPAETGVRLLAKLAGGASDDQQDREMRESGDRAVREILSILSQDKRAEASGEGRG